jgi:hypothetical protein
MGVSAGKFQLIPREGLESETVVQPIAQPYRLPYLYPPSGQSHIDSRVGRGFQYHKEFTNDADPKGSIIVSQRNFPNEEFFRLDR